MNYETEINGQTLDMFNAHLCSYTVGACDYENGYMMPPNSMFPVKLDGNVGLRPIELEMDFEGDSISEIVMNISNLTAALHKNAEIFLPDGFYYTCVFDSVSTPEEQAPWIMRVTFSFLGVRHKELKKQSFTQSGKMFVHGNYKTAAIIKITPQEGTTEIKVNGITVKDLKGPVVIDGIRMTVMENGLNKFKDTDITEFPSLECGENDVTVEGSAVVEISYYPIFL